MEISEISRGRSNGRQITWTTIVSYGGQLHAQPLLLALKSLSFLATLPIYSHVYTK